MICSARGKGGDQDQAQIDQAQIRLRTSERTAGKDASRYRQLERTLLLIELIAPLKFGATVDELAQDVRHLLGREYCERTVRRDLEALESIGFVERIRTVFRGERTIRFRWADQTMRGAIARKLAEEVAV